MRGIPLRAMPAIWLAIPLGILAAVYGTALYAADGYALGATSMATAVLPFVGGFVAATAAWEGARIRPFWWRPMVRSRLEVIATAIAPSVITGALAVIAATIVLLLRSGATAPDLRVLGVVVVDLVAWSAVGCALGLLTPLPIALPVAVLLPFIWFAFVPAIYPVWLRHITGSFRDCCELSDDLSGAAIAGSVLANLGFLSAAGLVIGARLTSRRVIATVCSFVIPVSAALAVVSSAGLGATPSTARDPSQLVCRTGAGTTLCVWPEHAASLDASLATTVATREQWRAAGIESPTLVTEAARSTAPVDAIAILLRGSSADEVILALARGLTPVLPDCELGSTGAFAKPWVEAWFAAAGGLSASRLDREFGDPQFLGGTTLDPLPTVERLWTVSIEARRAWVANAVAMIATCDEVVQDLTVHP